MTSDANLLTVISAFVLLCSKTCVNSSSVEWCPTGADVNLTGVTPDFSGFFRKNDLAFPPNATMVENDETFGCLCKFKTCVQLCCPRGYAADENGCVQDEFTSSIRADQESTEPPSWRKDGSRILSDSFQYLFIYYTSKFTFASSVAPYEDIKMLEDGSISFDDDVFTLDLGEYCILRAKNSSRYEIHEFTTLTTLISGGIIMISFGICLISAFTTFVIYTIISELKNLRGSILRCYLASYICCLLTLPTYLMWIRNSADQSQRNPQFVHVVFFCLALLYFGYACACWTNVMSFDTWKAFRGFEPVRDVHMKQNERNKFLWYSLYAWGVPFVLLVIVICSIYVVATFGRLTLTYIYLGVGIALFPIAVIVISNMYFYGSTALTIWRRKKETAQLIDGINKHHKDNQLWFNLYLRLYVIMGGAAILWIPACVVSDTAYLVFHYTAEALQGILIFITCVWRDEVKRYFSQLFNVMLDALAFLLRRNSTPASTI